MTALDKYGSLPDLHQMALDTQSLESVYEMTIRQFEQLCQEEEARKLHLRILLLEYENDDLNDQLVEEDDRVEELERHRQGMQTQIDTMEEDLERVRSELRLRVREVENLKIEIQSLNSVSVDSARVLTEKLSLSRELSTLRPELEHLRSQLAAHQSLLAEKLSLQRQLNTVQVELETEKRAVHRAIAKEGVAQTQDAKLESQIEALQVEVTRERRDRQKAEREAQKISTDFEAKKTVLESRLDAFRNKLRITKDQLKENQVDLQNVRNLSRAELNRETTKGTVSQVANNSRKRSGTQVDVDATIGTPGILPATKKSKRSSTLPGDKSTFSITPFLNRTASVAPESPVGQPHNFEKNEKSEPSRSVDEDKDEVDELSPPGLTIMERKPKTTTESLQSRKVKLPTTAKVGEGILKTHPVRKGKTAPTLEQVDEEANCENEPSLENQETRSNNALAKPRQGALGLSVGIDEENDVKRKKQKLLGGGLSRTLFDEDDGETAKLGKGAALGGSRGFAVLGRGGAGPKLGTRFGAGNSSGFGAFSPLKKDRRAAAV